MKNLCPTCGAFNDSRCCPDDGTLMIKTSACSGGFLRIGCGTIFRQPVKFCPGCGAKVSRTTYAAMTLAAEHEAKAVTR